MNKRPRFLIFSAMIMFLSLEYASASTYYIDWDSGSDSNNGTSTNTPWKHHPFMNGWTGSYTHVAGDDYIFKGGVTWTNAAFSFEILVGGTSSNRDVYGPGDKSWFSGGSWSRPIFDMENAAIGSPATNNSGSPIFIGNAAEYVTVDNFEIKNHLISGSGGKTYEGGIKMDGTDNVTISNNFIHDWDISNRPYLNNGVSNIEDSFFGGITNFGSTPVIGRVITLNHIRGPVLPDDKGAGGCFTQHSNELSFNECHIVSTGFFGVINQVNNNLIYDMKDSYDPDFHENGIWIMPNQATVYNNVMHDICCGTAVYSVVGWNGAVGTHKIYNNVLYNNAPIDILIDPSGSNSTNSQNTSVEIYNNTAQSGTGVSVRIVSRPFGIGSLTIRNNHWITENIDATCIAQTGCQSPITLVESNNLTQTSAVAASQGYVQGSDLTTATSF